MRQGKALVPAFALTIVFASAQAARAQAPADPVIPSPNGDGLKGILDKSTDDLIKDLSGKDADRAVAEAELSKRGPAVVKPLVACISAAETKAEAKLSAVRIVRKLLDDAERKGKPISDDSARDAFLRIFKDPKAPLELRGEAALALGDLQAFQASKDLIAGLADNWFKISESSRLALSRMGAPIVDDVIKAYEAELAAKDGKDGVIFRSLMILGDVGGDKARATLASAIKQEKGPRAPGLRLHAAIALGISGEKKAIQIVLDAYDAEHDARIASTMERSLEWLTGQHDIPPQPFRWRAWWGAHKDEILSNEDRYDLDKILIPKGGVDGPKKTDPPK